MKHILLTLFVMLIGVLSFFMYNQFINSPQTSKNKSGGNTIRYLPIGDSYTIGEGVQESERYPNQLVKRLQDAGIAISIVDNPAVSGYTTQDAIIYEIPVLKKSDANFVTILLGANDVFARDPEKFKKNYQEVLDSVQSYLPKKDKVVLLSIPDFSVTPYAKTFGFTQEDIRSEITKHNLIIKEEAEKRGLALVNLYELSGSLENDETMLVEDGLHPSAKQYILWEKVMYPVVYNIVKEQNGTK